MVPALVTVGTTQLKFDVRATSIRRMARPSAQGTIEVEGQPDRYRLLLCGLPAKRTQWPFGRLPWLGYAEAAARGGGATGRIGGFLGKAHRKEDVAQKVRAALDSKKRTVMQALRLLMVDDEPEVGTFVRDVAESLGYEMCFTDEASSFAPLYRSFHPDIVILDLAMPNIDGIELLQFLAEEGSRARILLMSGIDSGMREAAQHLGEAQGLRMVGIVPKPVRTAELRLLLAILRDKKGR